MNENSYIFTLCVYVVDVRGDKGVKIVAKIGPIDDHLIFIWFLVEKKKREFELI